MINLDIEVCEGIVLNHKSSLLHASVGFSVQSHELNRAEADLAWDDSNREAILISIGAWLLEERETRKGNPLKVLSQAKEICLQAGVKPVATAHIRGSGAFKTTWEELAFDMRRDCPIMQTPYLIPLNDPAGIAHPETSLRMKRKEGLKQIGLGCLVVYLVSGLVH